MMLALAPTPLIAILRGVKPDEAEAVASALVEAGFGAIEVPLNSPDPFRSIEIIAGRVGKAALVGAGTVLLPGAVEAAANAGAGLIVAPNADPAVIECALKLGLSVLPGVATPTEAFAALSLGATGPEALPRRGPAARSGASVAIGAAEGRAALPRRRDHARKARALPRSRRRRLRHRRRAL